MISIYGITRCSLTVLEYCIFADITENIVPYEKNVREKNFARRSKEDVRAAPASESSTGELCQLVADDNFAVAFRIDFHFVENVKVSFAYKISCLKKHGMIITGSGESLERFFFLIFSQIRLPENFCSK